MSFNERLKIKWNKRLRPIFFFQKLKMKTKEIQ